MCDIKWKALFYNIQDLGGHIMLLCFKVEASKLVRVTSFHFESTNITLSQSRCSF